MKYTSSNKLNIAHIMILGCLCFMLLSSCSALRQMAALRQVNFSLDRISGLRLAGIDMGRIKSYNDLGMLDVGRLTAAVITRSIPLEFQLHVQAENPANNTVPARLIQMDWTLFLEETETISGKIDNEILLEPGEPQDIPVTIALDLVDFYEANARNLAEMALSLTGQGGSPTNVSLKAVPTINTAIGPIRYPEPLTIISRQVGK